MFITVNEFIEQAYTKYNELKCQFIDTINWEKYLNYNEYTIKYCKDNSIIFSDKPMFSASILRHIDANKCLFSKLIKKPSSLKSQEYTSYYYDDNGKLIMSEFQIDIYTKQTTYYINNNNENVQITFFIMPNEKMQLQKYFFSLEYSVYDDNNRLTKCETYIRQAKIPFGISVYGEYYQYNGFKLIKAIKYDDYNKNFKMNAIMKEFCPTIVINPCIYEYYFEYLQNAIFCKKIRKYSQNEDSINQYELKKTELIKLASNGVSCFGI